MVRYGISQGTTGCLMGLDVGTRWVGVAVTDRKCQLASPLLTLEREKGASGARHPPARAAATSRQGTHTRPAGDVHSPPQADTLPPPPPPPSSITTDCTTFQESLARRQRTSAAWCRSTPSAASWWGGRSNCRARRGSCAIVCAASWRACKRLRRVVAAAAAAASIWRHCRQCCGTNDLARSRRAPVCRNSRSGICARRSTRRRRIVWPLR